MKTKFNIKEDVEVVEVGLRGFITHIIITLGGVWLSIKFPTGLIAKSSKCGYMEMKSKRFNY
jgi:hypothetical protein